MGLNSYENLGESLSGRFFALFRILKIPTQERNRYFLQKNLQLKIEWFSLRPWLMESDLQLRRKTSLNTEINLF